MAPSPPPSPPAVQKKAVPATKADAGTPSETLNNLAHAPANAINQANEAIAAREASGQAEIASDAGNEIAKSDAASPAPAAQSMRASTAVTNVSPGLSATTQLSAVAEASPAFLSFVATMKITSVSWTNPARAFINGRLFRAGEVMEPSLGIRFEGVDPATRQLIFKDRDGATVARRY